MNKELQEELNVAETIDKHELDAYIRGEMKSYLDLSKQMKEGDSHLKEISGMFQAYTDVLEWIGTMESID